MQNRLFIRIDFFPLTSLSIAFLFFFVSFSLSLPHHVSGHFTHSFNNVLILITHNLVDVPVFTQNV
ncbi:unnamed protein product [Schistosoma rodhaini]|nr:unnamed protein product [Schistosoma rodhaini]